MRFRSTLPGLALVASCAHHAVHPTGSVPGAVEHGATILFFSDAHVDLETHPELFWDTHGKTELAFAGGYARLVSAAKAIRAETGGKALLVDGGDTLQGSGAAAWSQGEVVVRPQRALGVDVGIPGNWEVVYGAERLKSWSAALNYPLLAVNIVDDATGKPLFAPYTVHEVDGLRVGFVGYTDPDTGTRQSPSYSRGLHFLGESSLQPAIDALRTRERPDLVFLITHVGLPRSVALADRVRGVDVILSGDTHERVYQPIVQNGILVVEPGSFASFLGRLDVRKKPGGRAEMTWTLLELKADRYPEDPDVKAVVDEALAPYRPRGRTVIGQTSEPLERYGVVETTADDLLTDAIRSETGVEIALSNGFRFAHPILPGPITEADLWRFYPVVTRMKVGTVTGKQLRDFWESEIEHVFATDPEHLFGGWLPRVSGMTVRFDVQAPPGARVKQIRVGGEALDDSRIYRIAACEREGDAADTLCRIQHAATVRVLDRDVHDVVRAYLGKTPDAARKLSRRVEADHLPEPMYSQFYRR